MKETVKMTVPYQYRYVFFGHLMAAGIIMIISLIAFLWALEKSVIKEILGIIMTLFYALALYSRAHDLAIRDNKPYSHIKPSLLKGLMFGVVIAASSFIMVALLKIVWSLYGGLNGLENPIGIIVNILFVFYTSPFYGIEGLSHGIMTWYSYILFAVVPPIATFLGYYSGCKGFELSFFLLKFQYEPKKKK